MPTAELKGKISIDATDFEAKMARARASVENFGKRDLRDAQGAMNAFSTAMSGNVAQAFMDVAEASQALFGRLSGMFVKGGLIVGAAIAGWNLGKWIDKQFGTSTAIAEAFTRDLTDSMDALAKMRSDIKAANESKLTSLKQELKDVADQAAVAAANSKNLFDQIGAMQVGGLTTGQKKEMYRSQELRSMTQIEEAAIALDIAREQKARAIRVGDANTQRYARTGEEIAQANYNKVLAEEAPKRDMARAQIIGLERKAFEDELKEAKKKRDEQIKLWDEEKRATEARDKAINGITVGSGAQADQLARIGGAIGGHVNRTAQGLAERQLKVEEIQAEYQKRVADLTERTVRVLEGDE